MRGRAEAASAGTEKKNTKDNGAETNSVYTIQRGGRRERRFDMLVAT